MEVFKIIFFSVTVIGVASANPSAIDLFQDMYRICLKDFSVSCVKPKALTWMQAVSNDPVIRITEDLEIVKKDNPDEEKERGVSRDIFDIFEDFLQSHVLVAKVPQLLRHDGPLGHLVPRSFQPEDLSVPLAVTGRSKIVKKVIVPFLLGLKFKTAVLVPLALALIALKTWKALTLGLLSFVLTGALIIFKISKPKVVNYEVIHYPQHHEHHVEHPAPTSWEHPSGYGRQLSAQEMAYSAYLNE